MVTYTIVLINKQNKSPTGLTTMSDLFAPRVEAIIFFHTPSTMTLEVNFVL